MKMKKLIATLLVVVIMLAGLSVPALAAAEKFTDVKPGAWYYTAVDYAVSEKLFSGTSSSTFAPTAPMTRAMFVRVLGNKAKIDEKVYTSSSFSDVKAGTWYAPYVEWAAQNGIVTGTGNGRFSPDQSVTREQMAVILYNYAKHTGCGDIQNGTEILRFPDTGDVSDWAKQAMTWAVDKKIISGYGGKLNPKGTATRAQVAQIFYNSRELLANGSEVPQPPMPLPSPDVTPSPSPSPDTDTPRIPITDEVRDKLHSNQNPERLLDFVLNGKWDDPSFSYGGTTAKWDSTLVDNRDVGRLYLGSWASDEDEMCSSSVVANGFIQTLTQTASDRFCITARDEDDCFCLLFHPADAPDSEKMREIKANLRLPDSKRYDNRLRYENTGWAGPMEWSTYDGAAGIAKKIEYYMTTMHPDARRYCITEPEPDVFYMLYSYGD